MSICCSKTTVHVSCSVPVLVAGPVSMTISLTHPSPGVLLASDLKSTQLLI